MAAEFCRGKTRDGSPCDCEQHTPSQENEALCAECTHGISKHPKPEATKLNASVRDIFTAHSQRQERAPVEADISDTLFKTARSESLKGFRVSESASSGSASKSRGKKVNGINCLCVY
jgi:hypothetical protein